MCGRPTSAGCNRFGTQLGDRGPNRSSITLFLIDGVAERFAFREAHEVVLVDIEVSRTFAVRSPGDVRRDDHAAGFPKRMALGQGLRFGDVETGGGDLSAFQRVDE